MSSWRRRDQLKVSVPLWRRVIDPLRGAMKRVSATELKWMVNDAKHWLTGVYERLGRRNSGDNTYPVSRFSGNDGPTGALNPCGTRDEQNGPTGAIHRSQRPSFR